MTRGEYDAFRASLPNSVHVVQWGDASAWKVGQKVFAVGGWLDSPTFAVTFKCSEVSFAVLKELPGMRPAPYLASRGLLWLQRTDDRAVSDEELKHYLLQSYALVVAALPRKARRELGLEPQ